MLGQYSVAQCMSELSQQIVGCCNVIMTGDGDVVK